MNPKALVVAAAVVCLAGAGARAAEAEPSGAAGSVYRVHPLTDGALLALGGIATVVPYALTSEIIAKRCPCDPQEVNSFDRPVIGNQSAWANTLSDVTVLALVAGLPLLDGLDVGWGQPFREDLTVYAEALMLNFAAVAVVKHLAQRPLPVVYAGQRPDLERSPGGYRSFYSGHTATTFAALSVTAVTLQRRYGVGLWPWLVTVGVGTSVGVERIAAGKHFYTDVIVGAAAGTAIGTLVPLLHLRPQAQQQGLRIVPNPSGLALVGTF